MKTCLLSVFQRLKSRQYVSIGWSQLLTGNLKVVHLHGVYNTAMDIDSLLAVAATQHTISSNTATTAALSTSNFPQFELYRHGLVQELQRQTSPQASQTCLLHARHNLSQDRKLRIFVPFGLRILQSVRFELSGTYISSRNATSCEVSF